MNLQSPLARSLTTWLLYGGLLLTLLVAIGAGYWGFRAFAVLSDPGVLNLYFLAVAAGVASFFSPCAFPLLPGYLSVYHLADQTEGGQQTGFRRSLKLGFSTALGVLTFNLILGVIIAVLGTGVAEGLALSGPEPSQFVRVFRGMVGSILIILGFGQLAGWNLKPTIVEAFAYRTRPARAGERGPYASLYLYGLGYNAAGMGCTGPILAGLIVFALISGGFVPALTALMVFSVTMGYLMIVVASLVAAAKQTLIERLKVATPQIKKGASYLLVMAGLFNLYTAINLEQFLRLFFP